MYTTAALAIGGLISLMVMLNGRLQGIVGPGMALALIHSAGLVAVVTAGGLRTSSRPEPRSRFPVRLYAAGALGLPVLYLSNRVYLEGGVLLVMSGMLGGQALTAVLIEALGRGRSGTPAARIVMLLFILPGCFAVGVSSGTAPWWIAAAWIPGLLLMVQMLMNAEVIRLRGKKRMLFYHYLSAALLSWMLVLWGGAAVSPSELLDVPPLLAVGGGALGVAAVVGQAFLLNRVGAVTLVLGLYLGQFAAGIILDYLFRGRTELFYLLGAFLILAGIAAGELSGRKRPRGRGGLRRGIDTV